MAAYTYTWGLHSSIPEPTRAGYITGFAFEVDLALLPAALAANDTIDFEDLPPGCMVVGFAARLPSGFSASLDVGFGDTDDTGDEIVDNSTVGNASAGAIWAPNNVGLLLEPVLDTPRTLRATVKTVATTPATTGKAVFLFQVMAARVG